jgi:hypothetical protein
MVSIDGATADGLLISFHGFHKFDFCEDSVVGMTMSLDLNFMQLARRSRVVPGPRGSLACQNVTFFVSCKIFNLISQIRVVSRDALKVFHQQHANFAEPMLDRKHVSSLIKMLGNGNVRPWSIGFQTFDRSEV